MDGIGLSTGPKVRSALDNPAWGDPGKSPYREAFYRGFPHGSRKQRRNTTAKALADLQVGEHAIVRELELDHPVAEHLMNLGFVPGLEVSVERSGPGGDPRVYRVEGTEVAMRRELSRHIRVSLVGAPAFGD